MAIGSSPAVDEPQTMVLFMKFNNDSSVGENYGVSDTIYDYSTAMNNGTNGTAGMVYNAIGGYLGDGAFEFDGVNQYVNVLNDPTVGENFTVMAWVRPDMLAGQVVISSDYRDFEWRLHNTGNSIIYINNGQGSFASGEMYAKYDNNLGEWQHFTITKQGTTFSIFRNGVYLYQRTLTTNQTSFFTGAYDVHVGRRPSSTGYFNGSIDEVIVYNRTLSNQEIWDVYVDNYGDGCFTPEEESVIPFSTTLCAGTYYFNDSDADGVITVNADDIILDCDGATFQANATINETVNIPASRGIVETGNPDNVTIKNCNFNQYVYPIYLNGGTNYTIQDSNFTTMRAGILTTGGADNVDIINNSFYTMYLTGIYADNTNDILVDDNYFFNSTQIFIELDNDNGRVTNAIVRNNYMNYSRPYSSFSFAMYLADTENADVYDNTFYNMTGHGGMRLDNHTNVSVHDNTFNHNDRAIDVQRAGVDLNIYNNIFNNSVAHVDAYDLGISITPQKHDEDEEENLIIYNNTFEDFGCNGIFLRKTNGANISSNTFSQDLDYITSLPISCWNEPFTAIYVGCAYKGFVPSTEADDNYTICQNLTSNNITIENNDFGNINVKLRTIGITNLTHDITDYWFRSWQNVYNYDRQDMWISNDWDNVTSFYNSTGSLGQGGDLIAQFGDGARGYGDFNVTFINGEYDLFINVRTGTYAGVKEINLYNKSNAFLTNGTSICNGSSSNINSNDNNINITLRPNEECYVLDEYNITEGYTRDNDPLWNSSLNLINNTLDTAITVTTYGWTNSFMYFSNGSVRQGGDQIITIQAGEQVYIYDNWDKKIDTSLNRVYKDPITSDTITFNGTGTAYFTNSVSYSDKIIINKGAKISLLSGGKLI